MKSFCSLLTVLVASHFIILVTKYFAINSIILMASKSAHEKMVEGIVRSPGSFFDSTPSGILINRFSNDLGLIDSSMVFAAIDAIEGVFITFIAIIVMCHINPYLIFPSVIVFTAIIAFFVYARPVLISCKQLNFQKKSEIFHCYAETINGLTQIRIYNQQKEKLR